MSETNLLEAFAAYKVRPARGGRSAMTREGDLVLSCWYARFKKAQVEVLRYEEDLSGQTTDIAKLLRTHLAEALSNECHVRVIVAIENLAPKDSVATGAARMKYYARKDLVGRVCSFDGERFVLEFRRSQIPAQEKLSNVATRAGELAQRSVASH
jgi:hypothetical protein